MIIEIKRHFLCWFSIPAFFVAFCNPLTLPTDPEGYCSVKRYSEIEGNWIIFKMKGTIAFMGPKSFDSTRYFTDLEPFDIYMINSDSCKFYTLYCNGCYISATSVYVRGAELPTNRVSYAMKQDTLRITGEGATSEGWENPSYYYKKVSTLPAIIVCNK